MALQLHNTLTRRQEVFEPLDPSHVRMYVCGPTVYDFAHIGNARPAVVFDVLFRLLRRLYPRVTYVRNITDVDDKIMDAARASGEPIAAITERTTRAYHDDMGALGCFDEETAPGEFIEPRATQHIGQMIAMIERLIARGNAYAAEGHVLFSVPTMSDYGKLSGRSRDELIAGARVEVAPYKKDPADFVLWKPSAPEQPGWDSPWGRGRPGWHIECSAMSETHLGQTFDIHGGGHDLIFPHHENEIAQSECAHAAPFVRYWVHNGFLVVHGEKMSKSLGNFFTVRDLLAKAPGEAIRLLLLKTHYRAPLDFTDDGLKQAKGELDRFYTALRNAADVKVEANDDMPAGVRDALEDDLNTPLAIAYLHEMARDLNTETDPKRRAQFKANLLHGGRLLGMLRYDPEEWFQQITGAGALQASPSTVTGHGFVVNKEEIDRLIEARLAARKAKNFKEADRIRDDLKSKGVILEDGPKGTTWKRAG